MTRSGVGVLLVLALIAPSVLTPTPAAAQTTDAVTVDLGDPAPLSPADGFAVPIALRVDPDGGVDPAADLQLILDFAVDGQPLADAAVEIATADVSNVTTDADGRIQVSASELGTWAQLTSTDGVDFSVEFDSPVGQVGLTAQVIVDGDPTTPVSSVATRSFDVESSGESLSDRIMRDYQAGVITVDDAAVYSLRSAVDPGYRADPYLDLYDDDIPEDPQALALFAATVFDEVSNQTRDELEELLTGNDSAGTTAISLDGAGLLAAPTAVPLVASAADFPDCSILNECNTTVTLDAGHFQRKVNSTNASTFPNLIRTISETMLIDQTRHVLRQRT